MSDSELCCWNCGHTLAAVPRPISRHEQCPGCFEALHCCRLCRHYRANASIACEDDRADPPVVKENANFCEYFQPDSDVASANPGAKRTVATEKLNALFGEAPDPQPDDQAGTAADETGSDEERDAARARLDALFSRDR